MVWLWEQWKLQIKTNFDDKVMKTVSMIQIPKTDINIR